MRVLWISLALVAAAALEVGGDAVIRKGLKGGDTLVVLAGCIALASYGVLVNLVGWHFSRLLGAYVGLFAVAAVLFGKFWFQEEVPMATWVGLAFILCGALIIQSGSG